MEAQWGPPPGDRYRDGDDLVIAGLELGDVVVLIQPPRGYGDDQVGIYHDPELAPAHHYMAAYRWLDHHWGADAIVHLGKHGTLEWLPGKMLALSAVVRAGRRARLDCRSSTRSSSTTRARARRPSAARTRSIVDHLVPPMMRAESYDELADLEALMDEYARLEVLDPSKLPGLGAQIWEAIEKANLQEDLGIAERARRRRRARRAPRRLPVRGQGRPDQGRAARARRRARRARSCAGWSRRSGATAAARARPAARRGGVRARRAGAASRRPARRSTAPSRAGRALPRHRATAAATCSTGSRRRSTRCSTALSEHDWDPASRRACAASVLGLDDDGVVAALRFAAGEIVPRLRADDRRDDERAAARCAAATSRPGPSGAPTRGRLDVLPTGRNFYSVDPRALPSELVLRDRREARRRRAGAPLGTTPARCRRWSASSPGARRRCAPRATTRPRCSRCSACGPTWHESSRRVTGLEVIPLEELGRPRIDVTLRISGFFRDAFPHLIGLLDDAVTLVAGLDEPDEQNFVAKHARAEAARLAGELEPRRGGARRRASSARSRAPTAPGCRQLLETRDWRDDADLAAVYEAWGGFAYGRGLQRRRRRARRCARASRRSRSRSRTSTRASTTTSTATTTTSTTAGWSRRSAQLRGARARRLPRRQRRPRAR